MSKQVLDAIQELMQQDVGNRGLRADPVDNLITACPDDFQAACRSLAQTPNPVVAIVTGFYIPHAQPPCGETDGPLGAIFLARAFIPLGIRVALVTDPFCEQALKVGLGACGLQAEVPLLILPAKPDWRETFRDWQSPTHLMALERAGPSHTPDSVRAQPGATAALVEQFLQEVPAADFDRCHTMKGRDLTDHMAAAHLLFEAAARLRPAIATIGIGDGGNEIGMGKIAWQIIRRNIPNGAVVACRVATDYLIVCGVSNWGAYGLAAGVRHLRGAAREADLFSTGCEFALLKAMVERGPLVDGVTGQPTATVDGLSFERYVAPLSRMEAIR
jgi:hypothetical protein